MLQLGRLAFAENDLAQATRSRHAASGRRPGGGYRPGRAPRWRTGWRQPHRGCAGALLGPRLPHLPDRRGTAYRGQAEWRFQTAVDLASGWGGLYAALGLFGLCQVRLRRGESDHARALCRRALLGLQETSSGSVYLVEGLAHTASVDACVGLHARAQRLMGARDGWHHRGGSERTWHPSWSVLTRSLVPLPSTPTDHF